MKMKNVSNGVYSLDMFCNIIKAKDKNNTIHYKKYWDEIKEPENVEYPITIDSIPQFEELNNMQINVFELIVTRRS
jgi:hypothetical protein